MKSVKVWGLHLVSREMAGDEGKSGAVHVQGHQDSSL